MNYRVLLTLIYSLHLIGTGLLRSIEAQAYKPNSLWFCLVTGLLIIAGAALLQKGSRWVGLTLCGAITLLVLGFYLYSFISNPEKDANLRIGSVILSSIAALLVLFFPSKYNRL